MRDPARIKRICELLEKAWINKPDQRFGQFLINFVYDRFENDKKVFYTEDEVIEQRLKEFLERKK
ncbi:MAG: hypothetical protein ACFFDF_12230 [Candidatus Odinarchaeota archaeon]